MPHVLGVLAVSWQVSCYISVFWKLIQVGPESPLWIMPSKVSKSQRIRLSPWVQNELLLEAGWKNKKAGSRPLFGCTRVFSSYAGATGRRLEPIWRTVAWQQNVRQCNESLSWGWSVTLCAGAVCMALHACICTVELHILSGVWCIVRFCMLTHMCLSTQLCVHF